MKLKNSAGSLFLHHSSGGWDGGAEGEGGRRHGFPWREAPFSIFRIPVFCAGSQKEINLTLKHWGLHLFVKDVRCCLNDYANSSKPTCSWHSVPLHSLFFFFLGGGAQVRRHMIEPSPLTERGLAQDKDLSARKSDLFPQSKKPHRYCKDHKNEWWMNKKQKEMCSRRNNINNIIVYWLYWLQY